MIKTKASYLITNDNKYVYMKKIVHHIEPPKWRNWVLQHGVIRRETEELEHFVAMGKKELS